MPGAAAATEASGKLSSSRCSESPWCPRPHTISKAASSRRRQVARFLRFPKREGSQLCWLVDSAPSEAGSERVGCQSLSQSRSSAETPLCDNVRAAAEKQTWPELRAALPHQRRAAAKAQGGRGKESRRSRGAGGRVMLRGVVRRHAGRAPLRRALRRPGRKGLS